MGILWEKYLKPCLFISDNEDELINFIVHEILETNDISKIEEILETINYYCEFGEKRVIWYNLKMTTEQIIKEGIEKKNEILYWDDGMRGC